MDYPILGCASVHIQLAADSVIYSFGRDWRLEKPIDYIQNIDLEDAAEKVVKDLLGKMPGAYEITNKEYIPEQFSLGYFSLPKRMGQGYFQPVYVALIRGIGRFSMNHLIVVPAAVISIEPIYRHVGSPSLDVIRKD